MSQKKGSVEWFERIAKVIGNRLVGIEVSHYPKYRDVTPRCQVTFIFEELYPGALPEDTWALEDMPGYSGRSFITRGNPSAVRSTVFFNFSDNEKCPGKNMKFVAKVLGFAHKPDFLNSNTRTARFLPSLY